MDLNANGKTNWYQNVANIIENSNIENWSSIDPVELAKKVKTHLYNEEARLIISEVNNSDLQPKLRTYKLFKSDCCLEPYLTVNLPQKLYKNIASKLHKFTSYNNLQDTSLCKCKCT